VLSVLEHGKKQFGTLLQIHRHYKNCFERNLSCKKLFKVVVLYFFGEKCRSKLNPKFRSRLLSVNANLF
jgi:hypothetical protein